MWKHRIPPVGGVATVRCKVTDGDTDETAQGPITFVIKIPTDGAGGEPWTITSGTGAYAKLHGRGDQVVDNYTDTPATFVLTGTVSQT